MVHSENRSTYDVPCCCSQRWILAYTGAIYLIFAYAMRINFSIAILCMDNDEIKPNISYSNSTLIEHSENKIEDGTMNSTFDWSRSTVSSLLTSYYYGYMLTQIPGGWLTDRFGGKKVLGISMLICSVSTILLPILANISVQLVFASRVVLGLASGVVLPAMQSLWARWAPHLERTKLMTLAFAGMPIGSVLSLGTAGLLCEYDTQNGWSYIFYATGIPPMFLILLWFYLTSDSPSTHPRITERERDYIKCAMEEYGTAQEVKQVPWLCIAKSKAVWAMIITHTCSNWTELTLLTCLPLFIKEVLKLDYKNNGVMSSIPYIFQGLSGFMAGQTADFIRSKRWLNTTNTRKLMQITSFIGAGATLIAVGFTADDSEYIAPVLLTLAVAFVGISEAGFDVNAVDFAPKYAGLVYAISNTVATIPGLVAPIVTGVLTPNKTQTEWRNVFYVCAGFDVLGIFVYGCFASGNIESWAKEEIAVTVDVPNVQQQSSTTKTPDDVKKMSKL